MRREIRFLRRGQQVQLSGRLPMLTLLEYLRVNEHAVGTKEGCAEGDCGACTVVLRKRIDGKLHYQAVNSCILLAGQADGAEVITVEDLADGAILHPVQQRLVEQHGSQCGFCTPGFVMALFALYHADRPEQLDRGAVNDWIAGNLCRCTGYRPIVEAALAACRGPASDRFTAQERAVVKALNAMQDDDDLFVGTEEQFFAAPASVASLAKLYGANPDAVLLGGATDVGLWITKKLQTLPKIIWLGRVPELTEIEKGPGGLTLGAMVTHEAAIPYLTRIDPDLGELMRRFAGKQIRSVGTIGGNIANGSPIGDTPPALIALGATLLLQKGKKQRTIPLEQFFVAYGKQDRAAGEFVRSVHVPKLKKNERFRCFKISKRFDQDISAVMGAFKFTVQGSRITEARIAFGGMAATPKRAVHAERALAGADFTNEASWQPALAALDRDYTPISDQRAGAEYRATAARAVLRKALVELGGTSTQNTRIVGRREAADVGA
ncbi:MAG TPA: xanthine dehydrogenase small subunit [Gemmatimonadales bacterium]|nr:xanthine dehydrogenase small subunit [Gemmatimonadales bacterium]